MHFLLKLSGLRKTSAKSLDDQRPFKLSKRRQKLYEEFAKKRSRRNENIYEAYKSLFESLKRKSKKIITQDVLKKYENDIKKSWDAIKEIIGRTKTTKGNFPKIMIINGQEMFDQGKIANL